MKRVILSIDPGTVTLGGAVWPASASTAKKIPKPLHTFAHTLNAKDKGGKFNGLKSAPWANSIRLGTFVEDLLDREDWLVEQVVCEQMEFRSNAQGVAAIADVMNVVFTCGVFAQIAKQRSASFRAAPVSRWKGQLTKEQVAKRILKKWEKAYDDYTELDAIGLSDWRHPSHDWDAVGIGLWAMGFFE